MVDVLEGWRDFNVAMLGATAALAGLVIVAASVNIAEIVKLTHSTITARLAAGIASLVLAIAVTATGLIPGIELVWYGAVVIAATLVASLFQFHAARTIVANKDPRQRARFLKSTVGFLPLIAYLAGGVLLIVEQPAGLVLLAAGAVLAIISAIIVSWVALVEVLR